MEAILHSVSAGVHGDALDYRADIDGLRALAVLAVVVYHGWPNWFAAGFVGVDIFFVISGFLITSIILKQLAAGSFTVGDFYIRRIRRIFPALALVLLATLGFGWAVLLHGEFLQIGKHALAGAGFVSNLVLWNEAGYFDNDGVTKPLLHLWSLGVEEQFYIVWPLILWGVFARRMKFLWVAGAIFALSMAANLLLVGTNPVAAFFSPLTRFWELMAGGVAAYLNLHHRQGIEQRGPLLSLCGALLLVLSFSLIKPQSLFPGWWAMLPVGGAFLLIMAGPHAFINRFVLARRPMVWIGLISYPLYLWHWPLLSYAHIVHGQKPPYQVKLVLIAAAVALAMLTYRYVELPIRARRDRVRVTLSLAAAMSVLAVAGASISMNLLRERIDTHGAARYLAALNDSDFPGPSLTPLRYQGIVFQKVSSNAPGLTVFLGDSVVQQYGPRIEHAIASAPSRYHSAIFATAGGCAPIEHTISLPLFRYPLCAQTTSAAYALANSAQVHTVVIGAAWYGYFGAGQRELVFDDGTVRRSFPDPVAQELAYASLRTSLARLRSNGKRVFLILQPPAGAAFDPQNMYTGSRFGGIVPVSKIGDFDLADFLSRNAGPRSRLIAIAQETGATIIEPAEYLCRGGTCPVLDETGAPIYTDGVHMRPAYSRRAATFLDQTILPAG